METKNCCKGCCIYKIQKYIHDDYQTVGFDRKQRKAGVFVVNRDRSKILLVQSRGQYWGPPKGTLYHDEGIVEGAIREVKEETGIVFDVGELTEPVIKGRAHYYFAEIDECEIFIQNHIENNDANGIGWFNLDCLPSLIEKGIIVVNRHCKFLIKNILGIHIKTVYKRRFLNHKN